MTFYDSSNCTAPLSSNAASFFSYNAVHVHAHMLIPRVRVVSSLISNTTGTRTYASQACNMGCKDTTYDAQHTQREYERGGGKKAASNNRPNNNRLGVCITGQLSRLELATKIDRLLKPARALGWDAIDLVMVSVSLSSLLACLHALHSLTHALVAFFPRIPCTVCQICRYIPLQIWRMLPDEVLKNPNGNSRAF